MRIDETLVRELVNAQFPHWAGLPIRAVAAGGWDNRTFHLGEDMAVRLPSAAAYAPQVEKEQRWLPELAPSLPLEIPAPLAIGEPGSGYPWKWSIYRWIEGDTAATAHIADASVFAKTLARFLAALQGIDASQGPAAGAHNFHRGGSLAVYDAETRNAIAILGDRIDGDAALALWDEALATKWNRPPVWVHGDVSPGNLLVRDGHLRAVIDFGGLGVGDPACDLAIAWTTLEGESATILHDTLGLDPDTALRGRAWALWKALIVAAGLARTKAIESAQPLRVIRRLTASRS